MPLAYPILVPNSLRSERAELFICLTQLVVELRALRENQSRHKCPPDAEETRITVRPVAFVAVLWALRVEPHRAVGEALCPKQRVNPVLETEKLPARISYIDVPVTANRRLNDFG